jgi:hypothetical protein
MDKIKIYGDDISFQCLEAAFKAAGIEYKRVDEFHRGADGGNSEAIVIALGMAHAASIAIIGVAKQLKKRIKFTRGQGLLEIENYTAEEVKKILPTARALYLESHAEGDK